MIDDKVDPLRIDAWEALAEHFLDTETRQSIPYTAWCCLKAGMSVDEARAAWRDEVAPVVGWNMFQVAGEWAGWDREWLVKQVLPIHRARWKPLRWLRIRPGTLLLGGVWTAIARCMELLLAVPTEPERDALYRALSFLAHHYFDFCPSLFAKLSAEDQARVRSLYPEPFTHALSPALVRGEAKAAAQRLRDALEAPR